jgi:hypothetical protein
MNQRTVKIVIVVLACLLAVSLSGCRKSDVITQIIYDQTSKEIDYTNKTVIIKNTLDSDTPDDKLETKQDSDTEKKDETISVPAIQGDDKSDKSVPKTVPDNKDNDKNTDEKKEASDEEDEDDSGDMDKGGDDSGGPSNDPNSREIEDENGNKVVMPEQVNKVVAAGDAAIIVQMLGGKGVLAGTSQNVLNSALSKKVFAAQGISTAKQLWSGDGSSSMSDSNFKALLKMKPDACVGVSGASSFSTSQIKTLKEKDIPYVTLPRMNTHSNVVRAVNIAGKMIGDRSTSEGGINAPDRAAAYEDYTEDLISRVTKKSGGIFTWNKIDFNNDYAINGLKLISGSPAKKGKYTLFISDWDSSATFEMTDSGSTLVNEAGVAAVPSGYSASPLSYYMSVAGTLNNSARFIDRKKDLFAAIPLNLNTADVGIIGTNTNKLSLYSDKAESFTRVWNVGSIDIGLGQGDFTAVVVDSESTKSKIQNSETVWRPYGKIVVDSITDYGFSVETSGGPRLVISYVRGDYDIYVNPYGITSWSNGSPESVLETIWASWRISGKSSEGDVKSEVKTFYKQFYDYDLSDSDISSILKGK